MAITGLLGALVLLMMLGGPSALVDDPWLLGVAIAPGLRLAGPWLAGRKAAADVATRLIDKISACVSEDQDPQHVIEASHDEDAQDNPDRP